MLGALIGDCIGSFWEFSANKDPSIPLWMPVSRYTDDSICTGAIAEWLQTGGDLTPILHNRGRSNMSAGFGGNMLKWLMNDNPMPYGSWGNGAAMRVSPVALWAQSDEEAMDLAAQSCAPTHNHVESVRGAQATVFAIRHAFEHQDGQKMLEAVQTRFGYQLFNRNVADERLTHSFDVSIQGTVPLALLLAVEGKSFEGAMTWCCSMGGDADTLAAIAGPIAEALYGIPFKHVHEARRRFKPEDDIWEMVESIYQSPRARSQLRNWQVPHPLILPPDGQHAMIVGVNSTVKQKSQS